MRFRRKSTDAAGQTDAGSSEDPSLSGELEGADGPLGPWDVSEVDLEEWEGVDLGSMFVTPLGEVELRLQVEEETGEVIAAVLVGDQGALELRAFAASRGGGAWDELRPMIVEEIGQLGGESTEQEGAFGPELLCLVPVQTPEGEVVTQAHRVVGHEGRNWLLRATLMGQPAVDPSSAGLWEAMIRQTVVRRGAGAMAPGSPLPLTLPPEARRVD
ncbi:MAG: hypothetical protein JWR42_1095 [Marmoricola sp.]|nr:hypothetical protein [Marmoricola sp.]